VCVASFEMKPHSSVERMVRQWCHFPAHAEFASHPDGIASTRDLFEQFGKPVWGDEAPFEKVSVVTNEVDICAVLRKR